MDQIGLTYFDPWVEWVELKWVGMSHFLAIVVKNNLGIIIKLSF